MAPRKPKNVTAVAVSPVVEIGNTDSVAVEGFISQALTSNVPVETLERLFALRAEVKSEAAKEAFIIAMAKFQSECPTIQKTKEVRTNAGSVAYSYAPIESIVSQVKEAIQNNGFSYSTNMKMLPEGVTVTIKIQHILGHSEETEMTVPLGTKTSVMSSSQVVAAASTFAKRYAFLNAFGILTGDEDNDGAEFKSTQAIAPNASNPAVSVYKDKLKNAKTLEELGNIWADMPIGAKNLLSSLKDEMKAMITSEASSK